MAARALPPTYVRSLVLINTSIRKAFLKVQFESCEQNHFVEAGAKVSLEHGHDRGGWTAVDPIKSVTAWYDVETNSTTQNFQSAFGVAVFNVELRDNNGKVAFTVSQRDP